MHSGWRALLNLEFWGGGVEEGGRTGVHGSGERYNLVHWHWTCVTTRVIAGVISGDIGQYCLD